SYPPRIYLYKRPMTRPQNTKQEKINIKKDRRIERNMICNEKERELGRQEATGACPYCGGKVAAVDVKRRWRLCFMPIGFVVKRKYVCTKCSRRLVLYPQPS
ncbi:hypothetical protein Pfo_004005, partial [Paulownia fortunei]